MPSSTRRHMATLRNRYTLEGFPHALAGVGRGKSHGLDACTEGQLALRCLVGMYLFNHGHRDLQGTRSVASITCYNLAISAKYDDLTIVTDAATNVTGRLLRRASNPDELKGLPGLRLTAATRAPSGGGFHRSAYQMTHLPTGATITVTTKLLRTPSDLSHHDVSEVAGIADWPVRGAQLSSAEEAQIARIPAMSGSAKTLIAGLVSRLCLRDPSRGWAVGAWYSDPLGPNLERPSIGTVGLGSRRLWGLGDHWELAWEGYPFGPDLVHALTDETVGIAGCFSLDENTTALCLKTARLRLQPMSGRQRRAPRKDTGRAGR